MLDKSIPYKDIYMLLDRNAVISAPVPPDGYSFRLYTDGDEKHWSRIETSVGEFASTRRARAYFKREFAPYAAEMKRRCTFVCDTAGMPVGTATAWWNVVEGKRFGLVHWVSVTPRCQGLGLGKVVTQQTLQLLSLYESGNPVMLHTQTWSHIAVRMYYRLGFRMVKDVSPLCPENEFADAVSVLQKVMEPSELSPLIESAVEAKTLFTE